MKIVQRMLVGVALTFALLAGAATSASASVPTAKLQYFPPASTRAANVLQSHALSRYQVATTYRTMPIANLQAQSSYMSPFASATFLTINYAKWALLLKGLSPGWINLAFASDQAERAYNLALMQPAVGNSFAIIAKRTCNRTVAYSSVQDIATRQLLFSFKAAVRWCLSKDPRHPVRITERPLPYDTVTSYGSLLGMDFEGVESQDTSNDENGYVYRVSGRFTDGLFGWNFLNCHMRLTIRVNPDGVAATSSAGSNC